MTTWILLRGLTREAAHWGGFVDQLAAAVPGAEPVTIDMPGTGSRRGVASPWRLGAVTDACREHWRSRGRKGRVALVGLSLGAMAVADWAQRFPDEVDRAVLINASMRGFGAPWQRLRPGSWWPSLRVLMGGDARGAERVVLQWTSAYPARHRSVLETWTAVRRTRPVRRIDACRQLVAAARYEAPTTSPHVPTLVAVGAWDRLVDPICSRRLATCWGSSLVVHPTAGHDLPLDAGPWLAERIARWCAESVHS